MEEISSGATGLYRRVALIGTGLIGGSLGMRLRERCLAGEVIGFDRDCAALKQAVERGAVDRAASSALEAVQGAGLVILAVPVLSVAAVVREIKPALGEGAVVTDVGSTKSEIMREVEPLMPPGVYFIGGHPMAGSEESGMKGADPALLENAIYVLTPGSAVPGTVVERLFGLIEAAGAQPLLLEAQRHDRLAAAVSHLPHLVAAALVDSASRSVEAEMIKTLAAGGFRDTTRVALGNPEIWRDICVSNRTQLMEAIASLESIIGEVKRLLDRSDGGALEQFFSRAREFRRRVPHRGRGILPELYEVVALVPDTPGVIGRLAGLLGEAGINISSIEILHVRELEGGSILLGFRDRGQQEAALDALGAQGYRAHKRS